MSTLSQRDDEFMVASSGADGSVAGYRLLRKLGSGSRAEVYLGAGHSGTAALKVFHAAVPDDSVGAEIDAVGRLDSPHFVRLIDVGSEDGDHPVLIFGRIMRGSLAGLVGDRDALQRGEVVTLVTPIAAALPALHRLGVAHTRIGAGSLHIGAAGEPVLLGFGHAELFAPGGSIAAIESEPAAAIDREALARLTVALLGRVRNAATEHAVIELIEWIDAAPREFEFPERLVSRLFDFAEPSAVEFGRPRAAISPVPGRVALELPRSPILPADAPIATPENSTHIDGVVGVLHHFLAENPIEILRARIMTIAKDVRKPIWIAAAAVAVALILALSLLPQNPAQPASARIPSRSPVAGPSAAPKPSAASTPSALPDDPVSALPLLLSERSQCIRQYSVSCLDGVDETSSDAYDDDSDLIEQIQGGSEIPKSALIAASAPSLTELLGDSALVRLGPAGDPASVLMIKGEAGWRIRSYFSGVPATSSTDASE